MMNFNSRLINLLLALTIIFLVSCSNDDSEDVASNPIANGQFALLSANWAEPVLDVLDADGNPGMDGVNESYPSINQGVTQSADATDFVRTALIESSGAPTACDGSSATAIPFVEFRATTSDTSGEIFIGCSAANSSDFTRQGTWEYNESTQTITYTIADFQGTGISFPIDITSITFTNSNQNVNGLVASFPYDQETPPSTAPMNIVFFRTN